MATYTVKKGDTMWGLTSRALREQTGRKPTNAEINRAMRALTNSSSDIRPGQRITIRLPGARGSGSSTSTPRRTAGARAASAADRYGGTTSRSRTTAASNARKATAGRRADAARYTGQAKKATKKKQAASRRPSRAR